MRVIKSREEIINSPYITKTEVQRLTGESYKTASRIYDLALKKDREELDDLIYLSGQKVRLTSVCSVLGIKLKDLKGGSALEK